MNTTKEILTAARKLIENPEHWTRNTHARMLGGDSCSSLDPRASCFCAVGAILRASGRAEASTLAPMVMLKVAMGMSISEFNDAPFTTHADVLRAFDRAIEEASP